MRTHIENEGRSSFDAVVYGGDFNVNKLKFPEGLSGYAAQSQWHRASEHRLYRVYF